MDPVSKVSGLDLDLTYAQYLASQMTDKIIFDLNAIWNMIYALS